MQPSATTARVAALFTEPLDDLGDEHPALRGILTPRSARGMKPTGVTAQFLENADEYHRRYANVAHFRALIDDALGRLDPPIEPRVILDIGSGSGNSVIPLLDRFPDAFVVATDISPQLLAILRDHVLQRPAYRERIALVCMDASQAPYQRNAFDLAVGAAILHHILEPDRVIDSCEHALRPGGVAVFFEPFEIGHAILRLRASRDPRGGRPPRPRRPGHRDAAAPARRLRRPQARPRRSGRASATRRQVDVLARLLRVFRRSRRMVRLPDLRDPQRRLAACRAGAQPARAAGGPIPTLCRNGLGRPCRITSPHSRSHAAGTHLRGCCDHAHARSAGDRASRRRIGVVVDAGHAGARRLCRDARWRRLHRVRRLCR